MNVRHGYGIKTQPELMLVNQTKVLTARGTSVTSEPLKALTAKGTSIMSESSKA